MGYESFIRDRALVGRLRRGATEDVCLLLGQQGNTEIQHLSSIILQYYTSLQNIKGVLQDVWWCGLEVINFYNL